MRAGWGLLLFIALFAVMISLAHGITLKLHHPTTATQQAVKTASKPTQVHEMSAAATLIGEGVSLLIVVLATGAMAKIERRPFGAYGLGGTRQLINFFSGLGWGILFLSLLVLALKTTGLLAFDARLLFGTSILTHGAIWLAGFLLVALLEETLLRGYLQFTLARGLGSILRAMKPSANVSESKAFGFWSAAFLLSLIFGLGHGSNPGESPLGLLSAGTAGLVFCLSLWRTGSLWWAIGFHTTWDWAQSFLYGVADSGTLIQFHLFRAHPVGRPIMSGGATGPEGSIFILPVLALVALIILFTLRRVHEPDAQPIRS